MPIVVGGERLGLQRRHVDAERAFALAGLALQAEVEDAVQPVVTERRARVRPGERVEQGVRAAPGGVLFVTCGHVRGAHDPARLLAAQPDVHAPVGGAAHAARRGEAEPRRGLRPGRLGQVAQVIRHGGRVHDFPRVHPVPRVEEPLGLLHRPIELAAEDAAVEFAAGQPVAVLARVGPAELEHQLTHLLGDRAHELRLPGRAEVDERADVQAPDRGMAVEASAQAARVQDLPEPARVGGEPGRLDGGVLDEGQRPAGARAGRHEQPQACLTNLQQRGLFRCVRRPGCVVAVAVGPPAFLQTGEPGPEGSNSGQD